MKFFIFGQGLRCSVQQLQSPVGKSGQCEIVRCDESGEERNGPNTSVRTEARKSTGARNRKRPHEDS